MNHLEIGKKIHEALEAWVTASDEQIRELQAFYVFQYPPGLQTTVAAAISNWTLPELFVQMYAAALLYGSCGAVKDEARASKLCDASANGIPDEIAMRKVLREVCDVTPEDVYAVVVRVCAKHQVTVL